MASGKQVGIIGFMVLTIVLIADLSSVKAVEKVQDDGNFILQLKAHKFIRSLKLTDSQIAQLSGFEDCGNKNAKVYLTVYDNEYRYYPKNSKEVIKLLKEPADYLHLVKKLNGMYLGEFKSDRKVEEQVERNQENVLPIKKKKIKFESPGNIIFKLENLVHGVAENFNVNDTYENTLKARESAQSFLDMLTVGQFYNLLSFYDTEPKEYVEDLFVPYSDAGELVKESQDALNKILICFGLDKGIDAEFEKQLNEYLKKISQLKIKKGQEAEFDDMERAKLLDEFETIIRPLQKNKSAWLQRKVLLLVTSELSNPEFKNVFGMYEKISRKAGAK